MTYINPAESAIVRTAQAHANASFVVTGFKGRASQTTTLYCDSEADVQKLIELLFDAGFLAASWEPNSAKQ